MQQQQQQQQQQEQQQQQQQPATQVIVIQQPVPTNIRPHRNNFSPYIRRGVKLSNGFRCTGRHFITMGVLGGVALWIGIVLTFAIANLAGGIVLLLVGGIMTTSSCYLRNKASQEYKALPPDHPDRITYSTPDSFPQPTTYYLPPGAQIVGYPPSSGGQVVGYPPSSGGQVIGYPPSSGGQAVYPPSSGGEVVGYPPSSGGQVVGYPPSPGGQSEGLEPSAPAAAASSHYKYQEPPPSYEEANKNSPFI